MKLQTVASGTQQQNAASVSVNQSRNTAGVSVHKRSSLSRDIRRRIKKLLFKICSNINTRNQLLLPA